MENALEKLLAEIYADSKVTPKEVIDLRTHSERAMVDLLNLAGDEGLSNALCKSFEVTNQLMQSVLLQARRNKASDEVKAALTKVIDSQIALLNANNALFG